MSPLARFMSGLFSTVVGKASVVILGLLGLMITTRAVPPADFGVFVLLLVAVLFLTELSAFGINLAVARQLVSTPAADRRAALIGTAVDFRLASATVLGVGAYAAADPLFALFGGTGGAPSTILLFLPALILVESLIKLSNAVLQGRFEFRAIGLTSVLGSTLNLAGITLFVWLMGGGIVGLLTAKLVSRAVALAYAAGKAGLRPTLRPDMGLLRRLLRFGFPLQLNFVLSYVFRRGDTFLISGLLGPAQVAFFEVARRIPDAFGDAYDAFVQVYFPFVAELLDDGRKGAVARTVSTSVRWIAFAVLLVALTATLFGRDIITLLFSAAYLPGASAFALLCVSLAAYLIDSTLGYALIAAGYGSRIPMINSLRAAVAIGLYVLFIRRWGLPGAALGALASIAVVIPLDLRFLRRAGIVVQWWVIVRAFAIYGVLAGATLLLAPIGPLGKATVLVAYLLLGLITGAIGPREAREAGVQLGRLARGGRPGPRTARPEGD